MHQLSSNVTLHYFSPIFTITLDGITQDHLQAHHGADDDGSEDTSSIHSTEGSSSIGGNLKRSRLVRLAGITEDNGLGRTRVGLVVPLPLAEGAAVTEALSTGVGVKAEVGTSAVAEGAGAADSEVA